MYIFVVYTEDIMETAKIFTSGNSQAIRIPKKYRLKGKTAYISKIGDAVIILPQKNGWESLLGSLNKFSKDFMNERTQPELENRGDIF